MDMNELFTDIDIIQTSMGMGEYDKEALDSRLDQIKDRIQLLLGEKDSEIRYLREQVRQMSGEDVTASREGFVRRRRYLTRLTEDERIRNSLEKKKEREKGIVINRKTFPDPVFRSHISKKYDKNRDGKLSYDEIKEIREIDCSSFGTKIKVTSLEGIQTFFNLEYLNCESNSLGSMEIRRNSRLKRLNCSSNHLTGLDIGRNMSLLSLNCSDNRLNELDLRSCGQLEELDCSSNQLSSLEIGKNLQLAFINCSGNSIKKLNLTHPYKINQLLCQDNSMEEIRLPDKVDIDLYCVCCDPDVKIL
ncbi:MAG: hypothetical protein IJ137_09885 [Eubacterium sp.]|nr:hypothetical protein [Eubacterium sp.]